jgi:ATP-binding cassette subfamily C (CFTR/MRP) protein 1
VISLIRPATLCVQLVASLWTLQSLKSYPLRTRTRTSQWFMWIKLVSSSCECEVQRSTSFQLLLGCSFVASIVDSTLSIYQTLCLDYKSLQFVETVEPVALAVLILLTFHNHRRSRRSSTVSLLFWPIYTVENLLWIHATLLSDQTCPHQTLYLRSILVISGILSCVLESLGLEKLGLGENPILTANVYSRWLFVYMTPLMAKGAREYITERDLPPLVNEDESAKLGEDLRKARSMQYYHVYFNFNFNSELSDMFVADLCGSLWQQLMGALISLRLPSKSCMTV